MTALCQYYLQGNILTYKKSIQMKAFSQILYYSLSMVSVQKSILIFRRKYPFLSRAYPELHEVIFLSLYSRSLL